MAGASIGLSPRYSDRRFQAVLRELARVIDDPQPLLQDLGEELQVIHDQRFRDQIDPEGNPWEPLSPAYQARKTKNPAKILIRDVLLSGTLHYQIAGTTLSFGTALIYGATHQFGDPSRGIPARPFLGLGEGDAEVLTGIALDHLAAAMEQARNLP